MQGDHKTTYARIPDEQLATLAVETAKMDCEINAHVPEHITDFDEWDALESASVDTMLVLRPPTESLFGGEQAGIAITPRTRNGRENSE